MPGLGKSGTSRMSFLRSIVSRSFSYNTAAQPTSPPICDTRVQSGGFVKLFVVVALAGAGVGLLLAQQAAPQIPKIRFSDNRLDNGLRVIIAEDHYAPVYAICVAYKVGSAVVDQEGNRAGTGAVEIDNREQPGIGISDITLVRRLTDLDRPADAGNPFEYAGKRVLPFVTTDVLAGMQPAFYFVVYPEPGNAAKPE